MNKSMDLTHLGRLHFTQNQVAYMQDAYSLAMDALAAGMGEKWVLTGCVDTGANITDGWIFVGGEIIPFTGGAIPATPKVLVTSAVLKAQYNDGVLKDFYTNKTAALVSVSDTAFNYSELKRLPIAGGILKNISDLHETVRLAINLEDAIILSGCAVSAVNTGDQTCTIAAGKALLNGVLVDVPLRTTSSYPTYLTAAGWTPDLPAPGIARVKFDPYTSQHYRHVLRRATTSVDEIKMFKTLTTSFVDGVGRWDMLGFSLMAEIQGRTPVGLWFDGVAEENIKAAWQNTPGNPQGELKHKLTPSEQGGLEVRIRSDDGDGDAGDMLESVGRLEINGVEFDPDTLANVTWSEMEGIPLIDNATAHPIIQPSLVVVMAIRTA